MLQSLLAVLFPSGGQQRSRRNAWAGMSECAARARARREADLALSLAVALAQAPEAAPRRADAGPV